MITQLPVNRTHYASPKFLSFGTHTPMWTADESKKVDEAPSYLQINSNSNYSIVINGIAPDEGGKTWIQVSPEQARKLALELLRHADELETNYSEYIARLRRNRV